MTDPSKTSCLPSSVSNVALVKGKRAGLGFPAVNSTKSGGKGRFNSRMMEGCRLADNRVMNLA